jgi:hypothetical protein
MSPRTKVFAVAVVALVLLPAFLSACPLCKDGLEDANSGVPNQLGRGFYYSILLMVSAPFVVVGALFFRIAQMRRRGLTPGARPVPGGAEPGFVPDTGARS